jgi:hypothetical protein
MQSEEARTKTELSTEEPDEVDEETEPESPKPPIDEDVSGSVNAALPDTAEN